MSGQRNLVLSVDFNQVDAEDRVLASIRFSNLRLHEDRPEKGAWVRLVDAEGNSCLGRVEEVRNLILAIRPEWDSWTTATITRPFIPPTSLQRYSPEPVTAVREPEPV